MSSEPQLEPGSDWALASFFEKIDSTSIVPAASSYKSSDVPVTYALELPIPVTSKGSTIKYSFSTENGDVMFGIFVRSNNMESSDKANEEVRLSLQCVEPQ